MSLNPSTWSALTLGQCVLEGLLKVTDEASHFSENPLLSIFTNLNLNCTMVTMRLQAQKLMRDLGPDPDPDLTPQ